jgi:thiol-disulfide isomerase/thioredoxin
VIIGVSLLDPRLADLLQRPFARLPHRNVNPDSNGLVLGLGLGLLFVPCAGPVLATIAVLGATHTIGFSAIILTAAFGVGCGVPLLAFALAGDLVARRTGGIRRQARKIRIAAGLVMILAAAAIGLNLTDGLQRHVPGYTTALQNSVEQNGTAAGQLKRLTTAKANKSGPGSLPTTSSSAAGKGGPCTEGGTSLENCGQAPDLTGITGWLNTPGGKAITPADLKNKVVLVDFWTYSCINCQRTLPHVEAWYSSYSSDGFEVIGVHTPEFAFEHVLSNVRAQAASLGVKYPVALDNNYATWNAYGNQYWPAEYLIDPSGDVRHVAFGEGDYGTTESLIRQLIAQNDPGVMLPKATDVPDTTPTEMQSPETYLGYTYAPLRVTGAQPTHGKAVDYRAPANVDSDTFALSGTWTGGSETLTAGSNALLELNYQADYVYLVMGGSGTVNVAVNGAPTSTISVSGVPKLYTLVSNGGGKRALLTLSMSPGVQAYDFTFG